MASAETVKARWVAGYHAETADKIDLVPGVTVVQIGRSEAEASDHWEILTPARPAGKSDAKDAD
jgi:hypothetical protein